MGKWDLKPSRRKRQEIAGLLNDKEYSLIKEHKSGKVTIDHKNTAHAMVKLINMVPENVLPYMHKKVMTVRLLGVHPSYIPLNPIQAGLLLGLREDEIDEIEQDGSLTLSSYIKSISPQEGINKFNREGKEKQVKNIIKG